MNLKKYVKVCVLVLFCILCGCTSDDSVSGGSSLDEKNAVKPVKSVTDFNIVTNCDFKKEANEWEFQYVEGETFYVAKRIFTADSTVKTLQEALIGVSKTACENMKDRKYVCADSVSLYETQRSVAQNHAGVYGGRLVTEENLVQYKKEGCKVGDYCRGQTREQAYDDFIAKCRAYLK